MLNHYHGELELDKVRNPQLPVEIKKRLKKKIKKLIAFTAYEKL
jgi:hypothetical protein